MYKGFGADRYWTSSEITYNNAWAIRFSNGSYENTSKDGEKDVRAIRTSSLMPNNISNTYFVGSSGMYYVTVTDSLGYTSTDSM